MTNKCVICGAEIPEGRQVCTGCEIKSHADLEADLRAAHEEIGRLKAENARLKTERNVHYEACQKEAGLTPDCTPYWCVKTLKAENAELKAKLEKSVEFPCKVGDKLYIIADCVDVMKMRDDDYYDGTGDIQCPFEKDCEFEECDDGNRRIFETHCTGFWLESDNEWKIFLNEICADVGIIDFGKTILLTRKEAEARLKELRGEKYEEHNDKLKAKMG